MGHLLALLKPGCHPQYNTKRCGVLMIIALIKYEERLSASAQIKYAHCSISPRKVPGIVIYNSTTEKALRGIKNKSYILHL
jgi:hypothetical protein